eukprot:GHVU01034909.1.p1 GENE.GHVU01034909.1~~GHVU01034909.1.p1  ORF type:complete len:102 (-),score=7.18 GHVU01034909.1:865-1170(-)
MHACIHTYTRAFMDPCVDTAAGSPMVRVDIPDGTCGKGNGGELRKSIRRRSTKRDRDKQTNKHVTTAMRTTIVTVTLTVTLTVTIVMVEIHTHCGIHNAAT